MSKYSISWDLYDFLEQGNRLTDSESFNEIKDNFIYKGSALKIEEPQDLIPFYTHSIVDVVDNKLVLSDLSTLEEIEQLIYPTLEIRTKIVEFDQFVKASGRTPHWEVSVEARKRWKPCPMGENFFCEPDVTIKSGERKDTIMCPFMYSNRRFPCIKAKALERGEHLT